MKIEKGKSYRSRDGDKYSRVDRNDDGTWSLWDPKGKRRVYSDDGRYVKGYGVEHGFDLVAEWQEIDCAPEQLWRNPNYDQFPGDPVRVQILNEGADLSSGDREAVYGPPFINLSCAGELKAVLRKWAQRGLPPGELEALDQVCAKLGRAVTGKKIRRDTYVDGAAYFAIAGEIALASVDVSTSEL
jgi:hypothetical protein